MDDMDILAEVDGVSVKQGEDEPIADLECAAVGATVADTDKDEQDVKLRLDEELADMVEIIVTVTSPEYD